MQSFLNYFLWHLQKTLRWMTLQLIFLFSLILIFKMTCSEAWAIWLNRQENWSPKSWIIYRGQWYIFLEDLNLWYCSSQAESLYSMLISAVWPIAGLLWKWVFFELSETWGQNHESTSAYEHGIFICVYFLPITWRVQLIIIWESLLLAREIIWL